MSVQIFSQTEKADAGEYPVTVSNACVNHGSVMVTHLYDVSYVDGTYTIEPANVTITMDSASKEYGEADPGFTGTVKGLVRDGDLGEVRFVREGDEEDPGTYKGVLTATYTENKNYNVTVVKDDFTIRGTAGTYTVSFEPNDGSGEMEPVSGFKSGDKYELPQCGFEAPKDKAFKCWLVEPEGNEYAPGETITVEEDTITLIREENAGNAEFILARTDG